MAELFCAERSAECVADARLLCEAYFDRREEKEPFVVHVPSLLPLSFIVLPLNDESDGQDDIIRARRFSCAEGNNERTSLAM